MGHDQVVFRYSQFLAKQPSVLGDGFWGVAAIEVHV
jgi:hypothetical protein